MKARCANGNTVERWYDRKIRSSVVRVVDPAGNQVGDADYSGCKQSADYAYAQMIAANGGTMKPSPVQQYLAAIGSKGGKAKGAAKVRGDADYYRQIRAKRAQKPKTTG